MDFAGELASVAVAQNRNVEQPERFLRRAVDVAREEDRARARAEERAAIRRELFQRREEALFPHYFQMRRALAARKNHAGNIGEIIRKAHVAMLDDKSIKRLGVRLVIPLDCDDPNLHLITLVGPAEERSSSVRASLFRAGLTRILRHRIRIASKAPVSERDQNYRPPVGEIWTAARLVLLCRESLRVRPIQQLR